MQDTLLIIDDEADLLTGLERVLAGETDAHIITTRKARHAIEIVQQDRVDVVLADIRMPEMDGLTLLKAIREIDPTVTVIMMTAYGTIEVAVESIKSGAYDFIEKPFDEERLVHLVKKALERSRLVRENRRLQQQISRKRPLERLVGQSRPMRQVRESIRMLGHTDITVLILGETGTGKDLAARAIHAASPRRERPLVTVNCPALPESILESELFGYRKGAFTGADHDHRGLFDQAHGGTIFLDEIGDLPLTVQTKLLRVLQEKEIKPLGDDLGHVVDVRILAATNQDLEKKMADNRFRPDLFYRLNVATLRMPALREIREDIPLLAEHFLHKASRELGIPPRRISPELLDHLTARDWPGNMREMENLIKSWCATTEGQVLTPTAVGLGGQQRPAPPMSGPLGPYHQMKQRALDAFTLDYLETLLRETGGNISLAARVGGLKRQSLQKILKRYRISPEAYRS